MPAHPHARGTLAQRLEPVQGSAHFIFIPHDADQILHHVLQGVLHLMTDLGYIEGTPQHYRDLTFLEHALASLD